MDHTSNPLSSSRPTNRCVCLFECECERIEQLISEWTSAEVLKTVQNRLLSCTDPTEIFARFTCVLFYREILNGTAVKSTNDNLKKATVAFRYVFSHVNQVVECSTLYSSCWERYQELASQLMMRLSLIFTRRLLPLQWFVEEIFSLGSEDSNCLLQSTVDQEMESNCGQVVVSTGCPVTVSDNPTVDPTMTENSVNQTNRQEPEQQNIQIQSEFTSDFAPSVLLAESSTEQIQSEMNQNDQNTSPQAEVMPLSYTVKMEQEDEVHNSQQQSSPPNCAANAMGGNVDRSGWIKCPRDDCTQLFKYDWLLRRHLEARSHRGNQKYSCDECGYTGPTEKYMYFHAFVHNKNNPFHCDECDFSYDNERWLSSHKKVDHMKRPVFAVGNGVTWRQAAQQKRAALMELFGEEFGRRRNRKEAASAEPTASEQPDVASDQPGSALV